MTNERRKQIRKRRQKRSKNKFAKWFRSLNAIQKSGLIIGSFLLAIILIVVAYGWWALKQINIDKNPSKHHVNEGVAESIGDGYTNFVLFGGDARNGDVTQYLNTDTIIIVSLNNKTKEVKMVSVYRDTLLDVDENNIRKCNSAYSIGGPEQARDMLNKNLDLNIDKYVTVNFQAVTDIVDLVGGIEVDVSDKEWREMNRYIDETGRVAGKKVNYMTHGGLQTLDGVQATTYARIRKNVGNDYARTERQRLVIEKVAEKAMKLDVNILTGIITKVLPQVYTNLTESEILNYAKAFSKYKIGENAGFPFTKGSGNVPGRGSSVFALDLKDNVSELHKFLFDTDDYEPSSTVVSISKKIANLVGNRDVEPNTPSYKDPDNSNDEPDDGGDTPDSGNDIPDGGDDTPDDGGDTATPTDITSQEE